MEPMVPHERILTNQFDGVIEWTDNEIEEYLRSLQKRPPIQEFRKACSTLFRASQTLIQGRAAARICRKDLLPEFDDLFLRILFQFELAREIISDLPYAANRAKQLLELAASAEPGPTAQKYLARVARCFTWGYHADTLILCRSVLEQVLADEVADVDVFSALSWKPEAFPDSRREVLLARDPLNIEIGDRVYAAHVLGRLSSSEVEFANQVRVRGNKAVHEEPPGGVDVFGTVEAITRIINSLCGGR